MHTKYRQKYAYQKNSNYQNDGKRFSRLHFAAIKNYKEIGEILLTKGADVNAKDIIYQIIIRGSIDPDLIDKFLPKLATSIQKYGPRCVFNRDETFV